MAWRGAACCRRRTVVWCESGCELPATAVVLKYVWLREKEGWCKRRCIGAYGVVDELTPQVEVIQSDPVGFVCWVGRQSEVTSYFTCAHLISGQLPYTTP